MVVKKTDNICVCCGAEIPEGRQVCPSCGKGITESAVFEELMKRNVNVKEGKEEK